MKQKDFLDKVQLETGLDADKVSRLTLSLTECICDILSHGDSLAIQGFGTFETRRKEERLSVSPSTGKRFIVPPKSVAVFRPSVTLKDRVKSYN